MRIEENVAKISAIEVISIFLVFFPLLEHYISILGLFTLVGFRNNKFLKNYKEREKFSRIVHFENAGAG